MAADIAVFSRVFSFDFASRVLCSCDELLLITTRLSFDCFLDEKNDTSEEAVVFAEEELDANEGLESDSTTA